MSTSITGGGSLSRGSESSSGRAPVLLDHSGGDLGARLTGGDEAVGLDESLSLHDLGPHAGGELMDLLELPNVFGVVVVPTTPAGFMLARKCLGIVRERHGAGGLRRVLVVAVGVFGRHPTATAGEALQDEFGRRSIVVIPRDAALAAGGRVPLNRVSSETRRAQKQLATFVRERMSGYRG
jgi:MinD-like ATPase involved in chromosome partitioning or flagellar assembly